jgi:hypothetical protein
MIGPEEETEAGITLAAAPDETGTDVTTPPAPEEADTGVTAPVKTHEQAEEMRAGRPEQ